MTTTTKIKVKKFTATAYNRGICDGLGAFHRARVKFHTANNFAACEKLDELIDNARRRMVCSSTIGATQSLIRALERKTANSCGGFICWQPIINDWVVVSWNGKNWNILAKDGVIARPERLAVVRFVGECFSTSWVDSHCVGVVGDRLTGRPAIDRDPNITWKPRAEWLVPTAYIPTVRSIYPSSINVTFLQSG